MSIYKPRGLTRARLAVLNEEIVQLLTDGISTEKPQSQPYKKKRSLGTRNKVSFSSAKSPADTNTAGESVPYHPWDTRANPLSQQSCSKFSMAIPPTALPHIDHTLLHIRDWCQPLLTTALTADIVAMAESLRKTFDETVELSLRTIFADVTPNNNDFMHKFWHEALRFQWWYSWCHANDFESMMIMVPRLGLSFWRVEEDWSLH